MTSWRPSRIISVLGLAALVFIAFTAFHERTSVVREGIDTEVAEEIERVLSKNRLALLQHRLAFTEWVRLDPLASALHEDTQRLLAKLRAAEEGTVHSFPDRLRRSREEGRSGSEPTTDVFTASPKIIEQHRVLLKKQKQLTARLGTLDETLANIFRYNAQQDLGNLDLNRNRSELKRRSEAAITGITAIQEKIARDASAQTDAQLHDAFEQAIAALKTFGTVLDGGTTKQAQDARAIVMERMNALKQRAFAAELAILRSREAVELLTEETNIILAYDFWSRNIRALRASSATPTP